MKTKKEDLPSYFDPEPTLKQKGKAVAIALIAFLIFIGGIATTIGLTREWIINIFTSQ